METSRRQDDKHLQLMGTHEQLDKGGSLGKGKEDTAAETVFQPLSEVTAARLCKTTAVSNGQQLGRAEERYSLAELETLVWFLVQVSCSWLCCLLLPKSPGSSSDDICTECHHTCTHLHCRRRNLSRRREELYNIGSSTSEREPCEVPTTTDGPSSALMSAVARLAGQKALITVDASTDEVHHTTVALSTWSRNRQWQISLRTIGLQLRKSLGHRARRRTDFVLVEHIRQTQQGGTQTTCDCADLPLDMMGLRVELISISSRVFLLVAVLQIASGQQAFKTQPRNLTVRAGGTALLKCEVLRVSGTVQWAKDELLLGHQRTLPGHPRYTMIGDQKKGQYHLQILNVSLEDDSPYECQVSRSMSSQAIISQTAWLNVQIPPSDLYIELESEEPWVAGREHTVTCTAVDSKPSAQITMFKDGVELTDIEVVTMPGSEEKLVNTQAEVTIRADSSDNGQRLVCRTKHPALLHAKETSVIMNVFFPPQAPQIVGLERGVVKAGTTLRVLCVSHGGNPLAMLHWRKNDEILFTNWEVDVVSRRASSLLSMPVTPEDNHAVLQCESSNQVSKAPMSITRTLNVVFEPAEVNLVGPFKAIEGKELALCCYASSSNPPVQIRWWLGFRELNTTVVTVAEGENGGMTVMSNLTHKVSREDNGLPLTCEIFNEQTHFSNTQSKILSVFYPPQRVWLDTPPVEVPLRSGTAVRLVCFSAGGNTAGRLTWFKNGKVVQTASKQVQTDRVVFRELHLTLDPSDNMASYRCDATNEAKKVLSSQTKLRVQFPPIHVKIQAKEDNLRRGDVIHLECLSGSSNPKANVSWALGTLSLQGVDEAPKRAEFGGVSVKSKLSFPLGSHHHGQKIVCQTFSPLLSEGVNSFYTLNVLFPPEFSPDQPREVEATEDEDVTLPVMVSANPDDITCEWTHQGKSVIKERDHRYDFPNGWVVTIKNVTRQDAGVYTLECSSTEGKNSTTVKLNVLYAPSVKMRTDPVYVDVGNTADLFCLADANPITSGMFSWKWMGDGEVEDLGEETEDDATGLLTIYNVTRARAGPYQCTADNGIGTPASVEGQLVVRFKPELQKGAQWRKVASRGDGTSNAELMCQAEGIPRVLFTWAKNGVIMDFANPRYLEETKREGYIHTSTMTVINVSAALDYGTFTCTAHNSLGEDSLDILLLSTNHPDPPSDLKLLGVTPYSVTLEWMPGFDGGLTQKFRVRYRKAGDNSYLYVDVFPPRATVYTITGLYPSTVYNFSVNALNAMGESAYADNNAVLTVATGGSGVRVYVVIVVVGGVLILSNAVGCFLYSRRTKERGFKGSKGSVSEGKKSELEGSSGSSSTRYDSGEQINTAAQRTLLIDSGSSEPESSTYETYGEESTHYYYPTEDYQPTLYPLSETPEDHNPRRGTDLMSHDYEEVRYWRDYQNLQGPPVPPPLLRPLPAFPEPRQGTAPPPTYFGGRSQDGTQLDPPFGIYDSMVYQRRRDSMLPFELRGELV
ncbi:nephrin [Chanos chanos]|uniref:Nephrin n=1 Tax=Chanos chanos TaxID=29144 RepID=A0A6J2W6V4_CHACN|nr:nephrin [Chanos chanos]